MLMSGLNAPIVTAGLYNNSVSLCLLKMNSYERYTRLLQGEPVDILPRIPQHRIDDVILFDPADIEYPIGLNLLSASDFRETGLVCSDLLAVFQRMFDAASWGDNIEQILRMCILSLLEAKGYTLRDIRRLLTSDVFRSEVVSRLSNPDLVEFWVEEFPSYSKATIGAVQRRLSRLLYTPIVRNILSQKESKLDFLEIMDEKKILLCNLSKGNIGQDNSDLFGQLLVSIEQSLPGGDPRPSPIPVQTLHPQQEGRIVLKGIFRRGPGKGQQPGIGVPRPFPIEISAIQVPVAAARVSGEDAD